MLVSQVVAESDADFKRLEAAAEARQILVSTGPSQAQEEAFQAMAQLQGGAFDAAFYEVRQANTALNLCRNQALARTQDEELSAALSGMEAAGR